eukprot:gene8016-12481_t
MLKSTDNYSDLQNERLEYKPKLAPIFQKSSIHPKEGEEVTCVSNDLDLIKKEFNNTFSTKTVEFEGSDETIKYKKQTIGVFFSGGPAAGGHNVVTGLFDFVKSKNSESEVLGFLMGPIGLMKKNYVKLTEEIIHPYRNQGGFDLLGTGRDKIKTPEQFESCLKHANELELTGLIIIGGDDSNTNACVLSEYFKQNKCNCNVVGIPKTIDGDLKGNGIGISFGHHTAARTYSELVGSLLTDNQSTKKYYSFVRLMGRDASHITLEVALLAHPNISFISEEVGKKNVSLTTLVNVLSDVIIKRAEKGLNYGLFLIPEGIVGFIPEMNTLIDEINTILAEKKFENYSKKDIDLLIEEVSKELSENSKKLLNFLPEEIREQLFAERDSHGNVQVSKIETERLFSKLVGITLENDPNYKGKFQALTHFFGYEGRCCLPTNFDCDYCYNLGMTAGLILSNGNYSGVMAGIKNLTKPVDQWKIFGLPLTTLMTIEKRSGKDVPVIKKALVELDGKAFTEFKKYRDDWMIHDCYS